MIEIDNPNEVANSFIQRTQDLDIERAAEVNWLRAMLNKQVEFQNRILALLLDQQEDTPNAPVAPDSARS